MPTLETKNDFDSVPALLFSSSCSYFVASSSSYVASSSSFLAPAPSSSFRSCSPLLIFSNFPSWLDTVSDSSSLSSVSCVLDAADGAEASSTTPFAAATAAPTPCFVVNLIFVSGDFAKMSNATSNSSISWCLFLLCFPDPTRESLTPMCSTIT